MGWDGEIKAEPEMEDNVTLLLAGYREKEAKERKCVELVGPLTLEEELVNWRQLDPEEWGTQRSSQRQLNWSGLAAGTSMDVD